MSKVDRHGLKMVGLRKACSETKWLDHARCGGYVQIFYDRRNGTVIAHSHEGRQSWTVYENKDIVLVTGVEYSMTMQEIADAIDWTVRHIERMEKMGM